MSIEPEKKSLLAPMKDEYEPTDADADRIFGKIQASLAQAAAAQAAPSALSSATASGPPAAAAGAGKKLVFVVLSCAALALVGAFAVTQHETVAPTTTPSPARVVSLNSPAEPTTKPVASDEAPAPAIASVSVDALPEAAPVRSGAKKVLPAPVPSSTDTLEQEARLLADSRQARQAGEGTRALALLDEHARTFPNGWLANDRAAERVVVLCSLGRRDEAVREATVFLKGRPKGPLTHRVEASCAGSAVDSKPSQREGE